MKRLMGVGFVCLLFAGCGTPSHLVYVHGTTMGLDVAASTEGTGRFVFGYDRDTYAIIPRKNEKSGAKGADAVSLAAVSCIYAKGLQEVQFRHFVSTGTAAIKMVKTDATLKDIKDSIQGGGEKCTSK